MSERAQVDNSAWDGNRAMVECSSAGDYNKICAGKRAGDPSLRQSHALPHHYLSKAPTPNADGVRAALRRVGMTQGLVNATAARAHLEAHMSEIHAAEGMSMSSTAPAGYLYRASFPALEVREGTDGEMPTLTGHFARFNEWTKISERGKTFMERIAPGAFAGSFASGVPKILFQHGRDPQVGDKVLGAPATVSEDATGARYDVPLFDTSYNRDLLPGLRAGAYGASFKFSVNAEEYVTNPEPSDHNPEALPERTITEATVFEAGPVTWPAYAGATAGVRSMTEEFQAPTVDEEIARLAQQAPGELAKRIERALTAKDAPTNTQGSEPKPREDKATPKPSAAPAAEEKGTKMTAEDIDRYSSLDDLTARLDEVKARQLQLTADWGTRAFDAETQIEWDDLRDTKRKLTDRIQLVMERNAEVEDNGQIPERTQPGVPPQRFQVVKPKTPENIYDVTAYRANSRSEEEHLQLLRDGAMRSVEGVREFGVSRTNREDAQEHIRKLLDTVDQPDELTGNRGGELARRILVTGSPVYRKALNKYIMGQGMSPEEQRALSVGTGSAGGFAVVYNLDPTVVPTSNYSVNPFRAISRTETISGTNEFKFVTSGAITAAYSAEATEASDNAPTLAQPDIIVEKAQAFVPFSIEVGQDWGQLQSEMAGLLSDAKDDLEATKFTTGAGHGSTEPKGIITGATTTVAPAGGVGTFAIADLYGLFEALPPRFRPRASWMGNLFTFDKIRQFDTSGGSGVWIGPQGLQALVGGRDAGPVTDSISAALVLGKPAYENTAMDNALTTGKKPLIVGDFRYFVIVDRIGMNIEVMPLLVSTNHRPTGQRGLYAYWRNSSDVLSAAAFRVLAEP